MQLDYHYHVIYHLAELAGFKASEAGTIAYASQYVDDSTESEPIEPFPDQQFDTVRTAHYNLGAFDWNIQKKIYMPFHFLPPRIRWTNPKAFSYVTRPASPKMNDWRNEALEGNVQWDDMSEGRRKYQMEAIKGKNGFDASNWAYFHRAAHLQRSQVLAWLN